MPARPELSPITQAVISVSEMARRVSLSRSRFFELVQEGIFPPPVCCVHTKRSMYTAELQRQCLEVRTTNVGINGRYVLFYRARSAAPAISATRLPRSNRLASQGSDPLMAELREGLKALGMQAVSDDQIRTALVAEFPSGTAGIDSGAVLASVFRLLRSPIAVRTLNVPAGLSPNS